MGLTGLTPERAKELLISQIERVQASSKKDEGYLKRLKKTLSNLDSIWELFEKGDM